MYMNSGGCRPLGPPPHSGGHPPPRVRRGFWEAVAPRPPGFMYMCETPGPKQFLRIKTGASRGLALAPPPRTLVARALALGVVSAVVGTARV